MKILFIISLIISIFYDLPASANYLSFSRVSFGVESDINSTIYSTKTGNFVAVGDGGFIGTSSDGIYWYSSNSKTGEDLKAIAYKFTAYGNDLYVAVGLSGTIIYSYDGFKWQQDLKITSKNLNGVINKSSLFIAVGDEGTILKSEGMGKWEKITSPTTNILNSITYGNGIFVAIGNGGVILASIDGTNWSQCQSPTSVNLKSVSFGNGIFIAVGDSGVILRSLDGVTWVQQNSRTGGNLRAVSFGDFAFFAVGQGGVVMLSGDGIFWEQLYTGNNISLNSVLYRNQIFIAAGFNGSGIRAYNNYIVTIPPFINLGQVTANKKVSQPFNVINKSNTPLTISHVSKSGSSQFTINNDFCSGVTLQPNDVCRIEVSFTSGVAGDEKASIVIKSSTLPVSSTISLLATSTGVLYNLNVSKSGNGSGAVYSSLGGISCGATCSGQIIGGSSITLYAIPSTGSSFVQWKGINSCTTTNPCSFTLTDNVAVNAEFQSN